jgi:ABC-2 type transport system permease protein
MTLTLQAIQQPLAFLKRDFLIAASYKSMFAADLLGILFKVITFYFIGELFSSAVDSSLQSYGGNYFAFLIIGIALMDFMHTSLATFDTSIRESQMMGTLEIVLLSPIHVTQMVLYSSLWAYAFTTIRFLWYLLFGVTLFGLPVTEGDLLATVVFLLLSVLAFAPLGILSATVVLVFKRGTWFRSALSAGSLLLGGVAYPISVLPEWIQGVTWYIPMTHSVNAMRGALLNGEPLSALHPEILFLLVFAGIAIPVSLAIFQFGVDHTKRSGTLTQY